MTYRTVANVPVDRQVGLVHEHGWQSWSPTTTYAASDRPHRPPDRRAHVMGYRPDREALADAFQGEGLLAVQREPGAPVHLFAAVDGREAVPSIRARVEGTNLIVEADGPVSTQEDHGEGGMEGALARWADRLAAGWGIAEPRPAPTTWCSWYHYYTGVTEDDVIENLEALERLAIPAAVVQLDDGYQAEIGDWLSLSPRFRSVADMTDRILSAGRRAGIWIAPFLVGSRSQVASAHPEWLVGGPGEPVSAGHNWDQDLWILDTTRPDAAAHLADVLRAMRGWGIDFFKIDFIYAAAIPGRRHADVSPISAYRQAVELVREAIGEDAYLLGCGAPILPSIGLVDAMRVSPDTGPDAVPPGTDGAEPSASAAILTGRARAFQHGRFWINDPDCLMARPAIAGRVAWADHVERYGGLRSSSDRLADLDDWGLETTRRILGAPPPRVLVHS